MVRNRAIVKNCPKCETRVAVATKSCKCGYSFFNARRSDRVRGGSEASSSIDADVDERRRTSRVRREKPNYYDSQQFEKKTKKKEKKVVPLGNEILSLRSHSSLFQFCVGEAESIKSGAFSRASKC